LKQQKIKTALSKRKNLRYVRPLGALDQDEEPAYPRQLSGKLKRAGADGLRVCFV
jgi:hypothetical protein